MPTTHAEQATVIAVYSSMLGLSEHQSETDMTFASLLNPSVVKD
jgi:hypothetical protein